MMMRRGDYYYKARPENLTIVGVIQVKNTSIDMDKTMTIVKTDGKDTLCRQWRLLD